MDGPAFEEPVCLLCFMGMKTVKLRRQHIHMLKTVDENDQTVSRRIVVCPERNIRSTMKV